MNPTEQSASSRRVVQPLDIIHVPGALLKLKTLAQLAGVCTLTLYRAEKAGKLRLVRMGPRTTRVRSEDARAYLASFSGDAE